MQTALGTECGSRSREENMATGSLWFLGTYLSYWERRRRKKSIGGPWRSIVNPNIQHPFLDFHAIIFIGKSTEAIESVAWKMVWCLGGDGEVHTSYPAPIAGERELHFCIHGKRESSCCSAVAEGGGMPSCFLCQIVISVHM